MEMVKVKVRVQVEVDVDVEELLVVLVVELELELVVVPPVYWKTVNLQLPPHVSAPFPPHETLQSPELAVDPFNVFPQ